MFTIYVHYCEFFFNAFLLSKTYKESFGMSHTYELGVCMIFFLSISLYHSWHSSSTYYFLWHFSRKKNVTHRYLPSHRCTMLCKHISMIDLLLFVTPYTQHCSNRAWMCTLFPSVYVSRVFDLIVSRYCYCRSIPTEHRPSIQHARTQYEHIKYVWF